MTNPRENNAYDYIIIGSGAGGSVLANRLSEDPAVSVLLVEAGGSDKNPVHLVPKGFYFTINNPKYAKTFKPEPYGNGRRDSWHRGRILGGSTTINGMVWNRGWAADYDRWDEAGNAGWNWDRFRGAYRAIENHQLGGTPFRGSNGPVRISVAGPREPASEALIESMTRNRIAREDDMNGSDHDRVAYVASNIGDGLRVSASNAFLRRARRRRNLTIVLNTEVERILFDGIRAVGVEASQRGTTVRYRANREVLVCGGAFDTPLLLERSGIGNPEVLKRAGVHVLAASPKVGENLLEHRGILLEFRLKGVEGYNRLLSNWFRQMWTGFKYLFTRDGVIAHGAYAVFANYASDADSGRPDTQAFFTPISTSATNPMSGRMVVDKEPGGKYVTYPLRPTSKGSIHITGPRTSDAPRLVPNFLATDHDRHLLIKAVRKAREITSTAPFSDHIAEELSPGLDIQTDAQILEYGLNQGVAGYHTLGTCAMGPDDDDVVDNRLRVRGTTGLRIVDASVFPWQPAGNNNAPTMALAWIAADIIKAEQTVAGLSGALDNATFDESRKQ